MILWINDKAGLAALSKGYGRDEAVNNMLAFMWCFLARTGTHLHCEWVHSAHNLADCKSRRDLSEVRAGGWCLLHLPLKPLRSILQRCALDVDFAASTAVTLALDWSSKLVLADLALDGMSELEMVGYGNSDSVWHAAQLEQLRTRALQPDEEEGMPDEAHSTLLCKHHG